MLVSIIVISSFQGGGGIRDNSNVHYISYINREDYIQPSTPTLSLKSFVILRPCVEFCFF